jgi:hypothetical protein
MSLKTQAAAQLNKVLRPLDAQVVRGRSDDSGVKPFLSARKTIAAARRSGLSLSDYIDRFSAEPGATASTVEAMLKIAELHMRDRPGHRTLRRTRYLSAQADRLRDL